MELNLIDFHSDTAAELYHAKAGIVSNDFHISLNKASVYRNYAQVFAIFTPKKYDNDAGWERYDRIRSYFDEELERESEKIQSVSNAQELQRAWFDGKAAAFMAVEDARILNEKIERLQILYDRGVRFLTLMWSGESCIGGAWDTETGLTDFGREVVSECFRIGIVPDVSHASEEAIDEVIGIAKAKNKPFIATHSDAYAIHPHRRNLRDRQFLSLKELGGVVGMNLYRDHLTDTKISPATPETVYRHIEHFMELGGEDNVVFGCDFDGASFPDAIQNVGDVAKIADILSSHNYSDQLIEKIFWKNAEDFLVKNL